MGISRNLHSSASSSARLSSSAHMSIAEASALSGLHASTIRFYEKEHVIPPVRRDEIGHRYFTSDDIDRLMGVACVAATGMPLAHLRRYLAAAQSESVDPESQKQLLESQLSSIEREQAVARLRKKFVKAKIEYWDAMKTHSEQTIKTALIHVHAAESQLMRMLVSADKTRK
jgi:DNA-binding transcriptional MerR regulator